ncbi:MAG: ABC transporter permease [Hormoscilla sp.]
MSISPLDILVLTWDSLRSNPLRSALTGVGVFMGVAAVSATLQVGSISRATIAQQLGRREVPHVGIWSGRLKLEDIEFLQQRLRGVRAIGGSRWIGSVPTIFKEQQANPQAIAVSADILQTLGRKLLQGRFFNSYDYEKYRSVVAIDLFLAEKLFQGGEAIDRRIYVRGRPYVVVGVVQTRVDDEEPQGMVMMPLSIHSAMTGKLNINSIALRPEKPEELEELRDEVEKLLKQRLRGQYFWIGTNIDDILEQQSTLELISKALAGVGAIALVVGGVGIANITIATVMERRSEIGLRLAIGARRQDILLQFILEAVLLSLLGGTAAIATVHGLTIIVADRFNLPYQFDVQVAGLSLGSAILVGVGAGFFPALQASRLDPVKALRSQ